MPDPGEGRPNARVKGIGGENVRGQTECSSDHARRASAHLVFVEGSPQSWPVTRKVTIQAVDPAKRQFSHVKNGCTNIYLADSRGLSEVPVDLTW